MRMSSSVGAESRGDDYIRVPLSRALAVHLHVQRGSFDCTSPGTQEDKTGRLEKKFAAVMKLFATRITHEITKTPGFCLVSLGLYLRTYPEERDTRRSKASLERGRSLSPRALERTATGIVAHRTNYAIPSVRVSLYFPGPGLCSHSYAFQANSTTPERVPTTFPHSNAIMLHDTQEGKHGGRGNRVFERVHIAGTPHNRKCKAATARGIYAPIRRPISTKCRTSVTQHAGFMLASFAPRFTLTGPGAGRASRRSAHLVTTLGLVLTHARTTLHGI